MSPDKALSFLGLAVRAGKVVRGEFSTEKSIKSHKAKLVIIAEDASDNTRKKFSDKCSFYKVPFLLFGTKDILGHAMGKQYRVCAAVEDRGFAERISTLFGGSAEYGKNSNHEAD